MLLQKNLRILLDCDHKIVSQYLKFVLERTGVAEPQKVVMLRHVEEWVNRQIVDEFKAVYPRIDVCIVLDKVTYGYASCMWVLPYVDCLSTDLRRFADRVSRDSTEGWIMLYGLKARFIKCIPVKEWLAYSARTDWDRRWIYRTRRLHLMPLVTRLWTFYNCSTRLR